MNLYIAKLMSGRYFVTVVLTLTVSYMLCNQYPVPDWFVGIFGVDIMAYYFGKSRTNNGDD